MLATHDKRRAKQRHAHACDRNRSRRLQANGQARTTANSIGILIDWPIKGHITTYI